MSTRSAIEEYRQLLERDPNDARTRLKMGDLQLRAGAYVEAVATYRMVAERYGAEGFLVKAVAVWKHVRALIIERRLDLADIYVQSAQRLADHYAALGLTSEAEAMLAELHALRPAGRPYR